AGDTAVRAELERRARASAHATACPNRFGRGTAMGMTARAESLPERDRLVTEHIGLVRTLAQRLAQRLPTQVELSDLISVGIMGLIDAAGRYRPSTGVPFEAFARRRVRG